MTTLLPVLLPGGWTVDAAATRAQFRARDVVRKTVVGTLAVVAARVEVSPEGLPLQLTAELDLGSVVTGSARRDADLRGRRFFDVGTDPVLRVTAGPAHPGASGRWLMPGELAMKGQRCCVDLAVELVELADGRAEVRATTALDRRRVGIAVPRLLVGREVLVDVTAVLHAP